ncbi:MAG: hypothetical protein FWD08_07680, partial [Alphaproteobacteria bacterium]|nr:hypothetical protein [Alphaproteobacteria bacterium]
MQSRARACCARRFDQASSSLIFQFKSARIASAMAVSISLRRAARSSEITTPMAFAEAHTAPETAELRAVMAWLVFFVHVEPSFDPLPEQTHAPGILPRSDHVSLKSRCPNRPHFVLLVSFLDRRGTAAEQPWRRPVFRTLEAVLSIDDDFDCDELICRLV